MPLSPGWDDLSLRLVLTLLAGCAIGLNRGEHGHPAGLRTTMLVGLAAAVAMIQVNLLLGMAGKPATSFVTNDLMRLPLGILSGMGFIGAGAILRRGEDVHGMTTAATLWMMTVVGLCFGGGQVSLGLIATLLAFAVLWGLKHVENHIMRERHATLSIQLLAALPSIAEVTAHLRQKNCRATLLALESTDGARWVSFDISWQDKAHALDIPALIADLQSRAGVGAVKWLSGEAAK